MKSLTLTIALIALTFSLQAQLLTRGTEPGEIYLSRTWYLNSQNQYVWFVLRSIDNGKSLSLQYSSTEMPGEYSALYIVGDAEPGVLYGMSVYEQKLYVSHNYAKTWTFVENISLDGGYVAGCVPGTVYKTWHNSPMSRWELLVSSDFGSNFTILSLNHAGKLEIGTEANELYRLHGIRSPNDKYKITYCNTPDLNFQLQSELDTSIAGYRFNYGQDTKIIRGAVAGELYLVGWHKPYNDATNQLYYYKIYYSNDYAQTFQFKHKSDDYYRGSFPFTAGREPGSFYVMRCNVIDYPYYHLQIEIDYSSDYGETFVTYFHDLDSTYIFTNINLPEKNSNIAVFPNPFNETVTFSLPSIVNKGTITIFNNNGKVVFETDIQSQEPVVNLSHLPTGVYFYKIQLKEQFLYSGKVVKY